MVALSIEQNNLINLYIQIIHYRPSAYPQAYFQSNKRFEKNIHVFLKIYRQRKIKDILKKSSVYQYQSIALKKWTASIQNSQTYNTRFT